MLIRVYPALLVKDVTELPSAGFGVVFRDLPGCVTQGHTLQHALEMAFEALTSHIESMIECGDVLPEPSPPTSMPGWIDLTETEVVARLLMPVEMPRHSTLNERLRTPDLGLFCRPAASGTHIAPAAPVRRTLGDAAASGKVPTEAPLTPEQKRDAINEARRRRYQEDAAFRSAQQTRARTGYRATHGLAPPTTTVSESALDALDLRARRVMLLDGSLRTYRALNMAQTAEALGKLQPTIFTWIANNQLPRPVLRIADAPRIRPAYHEDEVRVFIQEISEHEKMSNYYRRDHVKTRDAIFGRVLDLRKTLGMT